MFSGTRLRKSRRDGTWRVVEPDPEPALGVPDDEPGEPLDGPLDADVDDPDLLSGLGAEDDLAAVVPGSAQDPLWERPPASVRRYVLGSEKRLVCLRRHLVVLAEPVGSCVAGLGLVLYLAERTGQVPHLPNVLFLAWLVLLTRAFWKWLQWRGDWFIATDKRLLLTYGVVKRRVAMMPLSKVTDMSYNRTLLGRFLGYGELVMESAGQTQPLSDVNRLPMPDQVYVRLCEQLFGEVGTADAPSRVGARIRRLARRALPPRSR
ncbi:PH domain-containing protein [Kineococcus aurantiacus]|uniref:Membrane protein YdbS with pleckstrin-like domain n=1 Tax=Kineococcus aurantiacus TaxID=37633 RepID=A0A7Y9DKG5_9ACTN|nr:PH domain-containing protein [Kineococcus aurantiacus]NYD22228.1 membrane protein YdbS with pleckstrin-like domain [Kineococcus aurantiacus]